MGRGFSKCHPKYEEKRSDKEPVRRHVFKGDLDGRLLPGVSRKFPEGTRKEGADPGQWVQQHEESICDVVRKGTMLASYNGHGHEGGLGSDRALLLCYFLLW